MVELPSSGFAVTPCTVHHLIRLEGLHVGVTNGLAVTSNASSGTFQSHTLSQKRCVTEYHHKPTTWPVYDYAYACRIVTLTKWVGWKSVRVSRDAQFSSLNRGLILIF
jgi:hypothetical protein